MECCKGKTYPSNENGTPYIKCTVCGRDLAESTQTRSNDLNKAYFAWLTEIARDCENRGVTLPMILSKMQHMEVRPTKKNLHETIAMAWIETAACKKSSTELTTKEMQELIDALTLFFSHYCDCDIPFSPDMHRLAQHLVN